MFVHYIPPIFITHPRRHFGGIDRIRHHDRGQETLAAGLVMTLAGMIRHRPIMTAELFNLVQGMQVCHDIRSAFIFFGVRVYDITVAEGSMVRRMRNRFG
ncbi:hypothetical protein AAFO92_16410 [Roseovarius sp. CAU 1744]|uniref:hypothetical protein n=1 Tax=Roseovarius sp. CAU 1744 TaxID=3140368 RepID=UPI00325ABB4F